MKAILRVATRHGLGVKQSQTGVIAVTFPKVNDMTPILVTADNFSWCPEAMTGETMRWEGKRCLNSSELEQEIRAMYHGLMLLDPTKMIQVANELCTETLGRKSS